MALRSYGVLRLVGKERKSSIVYRCVIYGDVKHETTRPATNTHNTARNIYVQTIRNVIITHALIIISGANSIGYEVHAPFLQVAGQWAQGDR